MSSVGNGSATVDCCKAVSGHCSTQVFQFPPQSMMYPVTVESLGKNLMTDYFQRFCEKLVINSSQIQSHNQLSTSEVSWHQSLRLTVSGGVLIECNWPTSSLQWMIKFNCSFGLCQGKMHFSQIYGLECSPACDQCRVWVYTEILPTSLTTMADKITKRVSWK